MMATAKKKEARKRPTVAEDGPRPIDLHVGSRIRLRRTLLGMSQEALGQSVGLTFQQIQKYERGANRVGASRLFEFSRILDIPVSFFFDEMPSKVSTGDPDDRTLATHEREADPLSRRETLEFIRAYYKIRNPEARQKLFDLVHTLGAI